MHHVTQLHNYIVVTCSNYAVLAMAGVPKPHVGAQPGIKIVVRCCKDSLPFCVHWKDRRICKVYTVHSVHITPWFDHDSTMIQTCRKNSQNGVDCCRLLLTSVSGQDWLHSAPLWWIKLMPCHVKVPCIQQPGINFQTFQTIIQSLSSQLQVIHFRKCWMTDEGRLHIQQTAAR